MFYSLEEDDEYPVVEYDDDKDLFREVECPVFQDHIRMERNDENLSIVLKRKKMGDFVSTADSDWLIPDKTADLFKKHNLSGYKLREVDVSNKVLPFKLWEIIVVSKAKVHPDSGMKKIFSCEHCGAVIYGASDENTGIIIDESEWDGSDFFTVEENENYIFVTNRVKKIIEDNKLTGVLLVPSTDLSFGYAPPGTDRNWSIEQWNEYFKS